MKKNLLLLVLGLLAGMVLTAVLGFVLMPSLMIRVENSPLTVEATVTAMETRAKEIGWVVSSVTALDESVRKHGGGEVPQTRLINLCQAHHAAAILKDPVARRVSVFMPCTIAVYQGDDGKTCVSSMNAALLGTMMGGVVAEVMGDKVAREQALILQAAR